jgi:hypothetical protein
VGDRRAGQGSVAYRYGVAIPDDRGLLDRHFFEGSLHPKGLPTPCFLKGCRLAARWSRVRLALVGVEGVSKQGRQSIRQLYETLLLSVVLGLLGARSQRNHVLG